MAEKTCPRRQLHKHLNRQLFESGTLVGDGISAALKCGFELVDSTEVHTPSYDQAVAKFRGDPRVRIYNQSSIDVLPKIMADAKEPMTFFLDAHYIPRSDSSVVHECPLVSELRIIGESYQKTLMRHHILIDDVRLMRKSKNGGQDGRFDIDLTQVLQILRDMDPHVDLSYDRGHIPNDILVAVLSGRRGRSTLASSSSSSASLKTPSRQDVVVFGSNQKEVEAYRKRLTDQDKYVSVLGTWTGASRSDVVSNVTRLQGEIFDLHGFVDLCMKLPSTTEYVWIVSTQVGTGAPLAHVLSKVKSDADFLSTHVEQHSSENGTWWWWNQPVHGSACPPVHLRWKCFSPVMRVSRRLISAFAMHMCNLTAADFWSAPTEIFLPTFCAKQSGFKVDNLDPVIIGEFSHDRPTSIEDLRLEPYRLHHPIDYISLASSDPSSTLSSLD